LALFPWRKGGEDKKPDEGAGGGFDFSPEKARKFFDRAAGLHDATNFEFAMLLWLQGLRFEPTNMVATEGFFKSAGAFMNGGAKGPGRDTLKEFSGRSDLDRYLLALLEWSGHPIEAAYAVKALERASGLGLQEPSVWIAERALGAAMRDKKPRKEHFVTIMESLTKCEKFDLAVQAGEQAVRLDPSDARLASEVKNLSAESSIKRGGFDKTGEEGGFRANIRDAARQKAMEEGDRVVRTEEVLDRQIAEAAATHGASPMDKAASLRYVDLLMQRDVGEDRRTALEVLDDMWGKTQEFRFKERADGIRLRTMRARVEDLKAAAEAVDADPAARDEAKSRYDQGRKEFFVAQIKASQAAVAAYPTDLLRKFELGKLMFQVNKFEDAIALFQEAQGDAKNRAEVLRYLGLSFQRLGGFNDEAIGTLKEALSMHQDHNDSMGMALRYALMEALFERARDTKGASGLVDAEEAYKIASAITIKQINYRDVRTRRDELKTFIGQLKGP
jgi:tetratricopeptide (TPR) repeat protein